MIRPAPSGLKADILLAAQQIVDAYSIAVDGNDGEFFSSVDHSFQWDDAGLAPSSAASLDLRIGPAALTAALYFVTTPRDIHERLKWRRWCIETIDTWFATSQNASTGAMERDGVATGAAAMFGFPQVLMVARLLGLRTRWADQVAAAVDYLTSTGEKTWYINGNFQLSKSMCYWAAAWMTGESSRWDDFEDVITYSYDPAAFLNNGSWLGYGYFEDAEPNEYGTTGWFTETTTSTPGASQVGQPTFDPEYTLLQLELAAMAYLLTGDSRFGDPMVTLTNKVFERITDAGAQGQMIDCSGGSRHAGQSYNRFFSPGSAAVAAWIKGLTAYDAEIEALWDSYIADTRASFLNQTHINYYRGSGFSFAVWLLAAHNVRFL